MPKLSTETITARKTHILKIALNCFTTKGYHKTSMDDIAQEAGLSKGGIYVYFNSKKDLFLALFEWINTEIGFLDILAPAGLTAQEKLLNVVEGMTVALKSKKFQEMCPMLLEMWAHNIYDPDIKQMGSYEYQLFRQPLIKIIEEGIASGTFKAVDSFALASILIAIFEGLIVQVMVDETVINWISVTETLNTLINGVLIENS